VRCQQPILRQIGIETSVKVAAHTQRPGVLVQAGLQREPLAGRDGA
jgi:hypothetical protein